MTAIEKRFCVECGTSHIFFIDESGRDERIRSAIAHEATTGLTGTPAHKGDFEGGNSGRATVAAAALNEDSRESAVG
jgi:hypothetical protein